MAPGARLGLLRDHDYRQLWASTTVSQIGYILLGVALFTRLGLTAGIFYLIHHMIV